MNNLCFLKHRNDDAALLYLDDNGHLIRAKVIEPEYLPLGTLGKTAADTETRLRGWWERRSAPKTQSGISLSPVLLEKMDQIPKWDLPCER